MLILQCILDLQSNIIDFTNAFSQADITNGRSVFIEIPSHFKSDGGKYDVIIRFKKCLYCQDKSSRLWYKKVLNVFLYRGFVVSKVYPWLFMPKTVICVLYVDDCIFWEHSQSEFDNLMKYFEEGGPR